MPSMKTLSYGGATFFIVAAFLFLLIAPATMARTHKTNLAKQMCSQLGEQEAECLRVLYSDPKTKHTKDLRGLANIALDLGRDNATRCVEAINNLHSKPCLPEALYPVLIDCAGIFETSGRNFVTAKLDLEDDALTANYDVKIVTDGPRDCERLMADQNVTNAEVVALGDNLRFFSRIGDVFTTALDI